MAQSRPPIRLKTIVFPVEHGGWGFLFEPIVLGMLVAPTLAGACFSVGAVAAFLMRHPLKLFVRHRDQWAESRRHRVAGVVALAYAVIAIAAFLTAVFLGGWAPVLPIVLLSPFTLVYLFYDARNQARTLIAELTAPVGLAAIAPAIALAAGWTAAGACVLWILLMARTTPSIFYIRARLRLERGQPMRRVPAVGLHLLFLVIIAWLAWRGLSPFASVAAMLVLFLRASLGLSRHRRLTQTRQIGFLEIFFGLLYVLIVAIGYVAGL
jgi:hypothetical protein